LGDPVLQAVAAVASLLREYPLRASLSKEPIVMSKHIRRSIPALIMGLVLLAGCASSQSNSQLAGSTDNAQAQCASKWVASGNNGPKAGMYYQPNCQ
jgi:hypothetical protein